MNTEAVNKAVKLFIQIEAMRKKLNNIINSLSVDEYNEYMKRVQK